MHDTRELFEEKKRYATEIIPSPNECTKVPETILFDIFI